MTPTVHDVQHDEQEQGLRLEGEGNNGGGGGEPAGAGGSGRNWGQTMEALNVPELARQMVEEAIQVLGSQREKVRAYAELELGKLAQTLGVLHHLLETNQITPEEGKVLIEIQRNAARSVLTTVEGLGIIATEQALNAALAIGVNALQRLIGVRLA